MRKLILVSAAVAAGCGGGSPIPPDLTPAAIAEATKTLESAKPAIARAYVQNGNAFPSTANAPFPTRPAADAVYVNGISYTSGSATQASVVLTLTGAGNTNVDGKFLGMFAVGHMDGTVTWTCGTASAATAASPGSQTSMYPYLPAPCQH